ncbi:MAG TPA: transglycosylase SLT domain-containing protein [Candidatus Bipolaricaulis sp.]|nr:transglycosylase SLT domain-containing protein [Candidatus Bipolaricaulis sp.]HRS13994.1 transglycosylase SLT domain-containing protein [Candidatus Bipolaricaulis sp.]HRU22243.1 transglycosylase SLT domain-containing protein [Candidatus Bipolaricaulis sp.]
MQLKAVIGPLILAGLLLGLAALLGGTDPPPAAVGDYLRLREACDRLPGSLAELTSLADRDDSVGWQARVALGRWHLAHGSPTLAVPILRSALALYPTSDLRADLARALEASGRAAEARGEWEALLPRPDAVQAVLRLEGDPLRAAAVLTKGGAPGAALTVLAGVGGTEAALERARALAALGRPQEALPEFERYLAATPGDRGVQLEYGRALERAGEVDRALLAYRAAGTAGAYAAGLILEAQGRAEEAIAAYRQSPEPEAKWRAGRLLEAQGRPRDAMDLYWELARGTSRARDDAALRLYLLHRERGEAAQAAEAARLLSPALAWVAGVPAAPFATAADPIPSFPPAMSLADALLSAFPGGDGRQWAEVELAIAERRGSPADRLAIGEWYARHGDWRAAFRVGSGVLSTIPSPRAYRLAYPLAWWDTVLHWAGEYGVDPYLVLAVIREESGFSPTAVSSSDARGLMQLLPSTARWIAEEKLTIPYREGDLFSPDYNIRLGTWYLSYLLRESGGDLVWAVAAYNGGPGNLRRWTAGVASAADLPAHLRATETREYLGKVVTAWLTYRWLYGS